MENESPLKTIEERVKLHDNGISEQKPALQQSLSIEENQHLDHECLQRFIKINVQLMTEDRVSDSQCSQAFKIDR